ncbi:hypothetical protein I79_010203 [Cricetulus griseus]|uniref:Uncharacterized protein n=1 Tax=Cricetulus griseus TaxID=10029 RepID=G3HHU3_CRIGR|nr:hypothetical protein I79_010203 [Cricetulus griseus]
MVRYDRGTRVPQPMCQAHTGSLPVIALIQESGRPHMSHAHLNCWGDTQESWAL